MKKLIAQKFQIIRGKMNKYVNSTQYFDSFESQTLWEIDLPDWYFSDLKIPDPPTEDYCSDCDWKNNPKCNRCVGS